MVAKKKSDFIVESVRGRVAIKLTALKYIEYGTFKFSRDDLLAIAKIFRHDQPDDQAIISLKRFMRRKDFKMAVADEVVEVFKANGWSPEDLTERLTETYNMAKDSKSPDTMLKAIKVGVDVVVPKTQKVIEAGAMEARQLPSSLKGLTE